MNAFNSSRKKCHPSATATMGKDNSEIASSFASFFEDWLVRQEHYLELLESATENRRGAQQWDLEDLVDRVLSHYQQYYDEKEKIVRSDASVLFSPPWLTSLECAFLWLGGFKPGMVVELVLGSVGRELTEDQARRMEGVRIRTRIMEREMNDEMARLQESLASPPLLKAAKQWADSPYWNGEVEKEAAAVGAMRAGMEDAILNADMMRVMIALEVMKILDLGQRIKFLAAAGQLQLRLRGWGLQRDA